MQISYNDHKFLKCDLGEPSIDNLLWSTSQKRFEYVSKTSWKCFNKKILTWWYVLKTSWRRLEDFSKTFLQDVLKTFWRRLENALARRLEDALKTSWRRLEDVFKTLLQVKTNNSNEKNDYCNLKDIDSSSSNLANYDASYKKLVTPVKIFCPCWETFLGKIWTE